MADQNKTERDTMITIYEFIVVQSCYLFLGCQHHPVDNAYNDDGDGESDADGDDDGNVTITSDSTMVETTMVLSR